MVRVCTLVDPRAVWPGDGGYEIELRSSEPFLAALLGGAPGFVIERPSWLRDRRCERLARIARRHAVESEIDREIATP